MRNEPSDVRRQRPRGCSASCQKLYQQRAHSSPVVPPMRPTYGILSLASAIARILRYVALSSGLPTAAIVRSFSLRHQARASSPSISSSHRCGSAFTSRCAADTGRLDGSSEAPAKPARLHAATRRRGRSAEYIAQCCAAAAVKHTPRKQHSCEINTGLSK